MKQTILAVVVLAAAAVVVRADDGLIASGKKVVEDSKPKCSMCHQIDGKGGKMGKPLEQLVADHPDEFLKGSLLEPKKTLKPDTKMPAYKYSDEEVAAVIAYMKSLKK